MDKDRNVTINNLNITGIDDETEQAIRAIARDEIHKTLTEMRLAPIDLTSKLDR